MIKSFTVKTIVIACLAVTTLTACNDDKKTAAIVNGTPVSSEMLNAVMRFKRVPERDAKVYDAARDEFLHREALAAAIMQESVLDQQMTDAELADFRQQMIISRYFEQYLKDKVSDAAVENFYAQNGDKYTSHQAHAAHILFRVTPKMSEQERQAVLTKAQEAWSKLQTGQDFSELAKQISEDDVSKAKGGDMGWVRQGTVDKLFSETLFNLKTGEVSQPIQTAYGFHVIKLLEEPKTVQQPLESVKGDIRYQLRNQAKQAEMERLQGKVKIEKKAGFTNKPPTVVEADKKSS